MKDQAKGHPSSQGWTTLQTFRTPELTRIVCARYVEGGVSASFWKYDSKKQAQGTHVDWELTHEISLKHHAVVALHNVYLEGLTAERISRSGFNDL